MGLRSAAYICQRVTDATVFAHRKFNYWSINYLDDFGSAEKERLAWDSYNKLGKILVDIGVKEVKDKAVAPTTRMDFLGNMVDAERLTLEVSHERKQELLKLVDKWLIKVTLNKKQLQSLIGKLSFITNCVRPGRIFLARLIQVLKETLNTGVTMVHPEIRKDLNWWKHFLPTFNRVSILWLQDVAQIDELLALDASLIGGGATHRKEFIHFKFPENINTATNHISVKELLTIVVAVKIWSEQLAGKVVRFFTDNEAAMHAINHGRVKDPFMLSCLRELTWYTAKFQILLRAHYVNTCRNILPDTLSRWYQSAEARCIVKRNTDKQWKRHIVHERLFHFHHTF